MMPKAFITGATGFVGGRLAKCLLADGWQVHALAGRSGGGRISQEGLSVYEHDGSMQSLQDLLASVRPDVVFHLASLFLSDHKASDIPALVESNLLLGTQLAEAMTTAGTRRLVNAGTSWQHFGTEDYLPVNLYAATKQAFEDILSYYHHARGLSCLTLKLFDTYGPGDPRPKLVNLLLKAARSGLPLDLSPGNQVLDLSHVDDVAEAFLVAAEHLLARPDFPTAPPLMESFLVGGQRMTIHALVASIELATGRPIRANWGLRPYRSREVMMPVAAEGRGLPGWAPRHEFQEGLRETYVSQGKG